MTAPDRNTTNDPTNPWLGRGFVFVLFLAVAVVFSNNHTDPDLWGHVQYGRDVLTNGLPETATYTYTAPDHRWINHENLAELALAIGVQIVGPTVLVVIKCLLGVAIVFFVWRQAVRHCASQLTTAVVMLLVALNMMHFWSMRPQLFSFAYFTLLIVLLAWCFDGWQGRWHLPQIWKKDGAKQSTELSYSWRRIHALWLVVPLMIVWANSHGAFVAGFCVVVAYLGCRGIEAFACEGGKAWRLISYFAVIVLAGGLATLLNPYGI